MRKRILLSIGIIITSLIVWFLINRFLHIIEVGPNPTYKFSPNFVMVRGSLYYIPDPNNLDNQDCAIKEYVKAFYIKSNWFLGKTENEYFAIDMQSKVIHYPLSSEQEITSISNMTVKSEDWVDTERERMKSEFLLRNPEVVKFGKIFNISFWFIFTFLGLGCFVWIRKTPQRH